MKGKVSAWPFSEELSRRGRKWSCFSRRIIGREWEMRKRNQNIIKLIFSSFRLPFGASVYSGNKHNFVCAFFFASKSKSKAKEPKDEEDSNYMFLCILKERWINKKFMKTRSCFVLDDVGSRGPGNKLEDVRRRKVKLSKSFCLLIYALLRRSS